MSTLFIKYRNGYSINRKEFRNKTPLYRIDRPWFVDLRVLHGLGGVASYYGTIPVNWDLGKKTERLIIL